MKTTIFAVAALVMGSAFTAEFPYATDMEVRNEKGSAESTLFEVPVEIPTVNGGMPMTDSVVTLYAAVVDFCASDEENWTKGTNAVGTVQAALTLKLVEGVCKWMGYADGEWKEFAADGAVAEYGEWAVKVDIDYSVEPALIRYSVKKPDASDYVALRTGGRDWVPVGTVSGEQKVNQVLLYGCGETGLVQAKSGARAASAGSVTAANNLTLDSTNLVISINATDTWGVNSAKVTINGQEKTATLVNGVAVIDVSDCIEMGENYTYDVALIGGYRGKDLSVDCGTKEVFIGNQDIWFTYEGGVFSNAAPDANLTNEGGLLSAAQVSPRGCVNPAGNAPDEVVSIEIVSAMVVAGAVRESALATLDTANAKAALTVVRFDDGSRDWTVCTADGWKRMTGTDISAANGTYTVRMSFNYRDDAKTVTYAVKNAAGEFVTLADADGQEDFVAGDAVVAKASLLGGKVSSIIATCKSIPKAEEDPVIDPSQGETEIEVKAADATAAGEKALAAIVVPSAAGSTPEAEAAYRGCFKVVSATPVSGKNGSFAVFIALDETVVQPDAVTEDVAADLDKIAAAFAEGDESGAIMIDAKDLRPGLWYSIASSAVVGFGTDAVVEGDRVQATGEAIQLKAKKPEDVENACFFRVLVNAMQRRLNCH